MSIRLSICVPTYNRVIYLQECLDSIIASMERYETQIEILISDNASADGTADLVNKYQKHNPKIRYHRNETNIGAERNLYQLAKMCQGEFLWLFGDDDKMTKEAVAEVLHRIESGYNLIICNYSIWSKDFLVQNTARNLIKKDKDFIHHNDLMGTFGLHVGYLSSVIIKRPLFFKLPFSEYEAFCEYGFPFAYSVYTGIMGECCATYIAAPVVCNRSANSGNYDWCKYFIVGGALIFETLLLKSYSKQAVSSAKSGVIKDYIVPYIVTSRSKGIHNRKEIIRAMFPHYKSNGLFWMLCLPLCVIPVFLARPLKSILMMIRRMKSK
ncbi:MAG: glycosyltransferase family 2 protein [Nitrospirota bacterium]